MSPDWDRIEMCLIIGTFSALALIVIGRWILMKLATDPSKRLQDEGKDHE